MVRLSVLHCPTRPLLADAAVQPAAHAATTGIAGRAGVRHQRQVARLSERGGTTWSGSVRAWLLDGAAANAESGRQHPWSALRTAARATRVGQHDGHLSLRQRVPVLCAPAHGQAPAVFGGDPGACLRPLARSRPAPFDERTLLNERRPLADGA